MKKTKIHICVSLIVIFTFLIVFSYNVLPKDCYPTPPNPELIVNGNFELGLFGFKTTYDTNYIKFPKNIKITTNPYNEYYTFDSCADPVTPNGKFLIVNGNDLFDGLNIVWEQEIEVLPNNFYKFQYMYANIDAKVDTNKNLPIIQVSFNDKFFDTVYVPKETCQWQTRSFIWYSGNNTKLTIRFRDLQLKYFGNDFALDEISLKSLCDVQACSGEDKEICAGDTVILGDVTNHSAIQGFKPYKFRWFPEEGLDSPFSPNPLAFPQRTTTYYLEVTDSLGCVAFDSVTVVVHLRPLALITPNKSLPICPCDSITLVATEGLKYLWSTGDTTSSITVKDEGYYKLRVESPFGCIDTTGIYVSKYQVSTTLKFDTLYAMIGEIVTLPLKLVSETNHFICGYDSFKVVVSYNPSLLLPMNLKPTLSNGNIEKIEISGFSLKEILDSLVFFVTLGNDTSTNITLESFQWNCDKVDVQTINGKVIISNICKEGGNRLFELTNKLFLSEIPNPLTSDLTISFYAIERGRTQVKLVNNLGEIISIPFDKFVEPGFNYFRINKSQLSSSLYHLILETPTNRIVHSFIVID
ncbi:MAG: hypothetical protein CH6_2503 [Candidatus Kapaibacterium sp.]|nr:MAG: hypothetical protein CH6_2503 [Candidatus Kapabacteria bacterium]